MAKIGRIIYLIDYPFSQRDYDRYGVGLLKNNEFKVEVWDLTPFLRPKIFANKIAIDQVKHEEDKLFLDQDSALAAIRQLGSDCFIVCLIPYCLDSYAVYQAISRKHLPYAVFIGNTTPSISNSVRKESAIGKALRKIRRIKLNYMGERLFPYLPYKLLGIDPVTYILAGGEKSNSSSYPVAAKSEIMWLHALDYDIYLKSKDMPARGGSRTAVFLDEYMPFHPDYIYAGIAPHATAEDYYKALCQFFDRVEENLKVKIIIAAHPHSEYEKHPDYFNGRTIIKRQTAELVREAELVIAHSSTSINFAVLFNKPLIIVTTDKLEQSSLKPFIDTIALSLGKKVININKPGEIDFNAELKINQEYYLRHKQYYIKKAGTEELPFWQIVANRLKRL